MFREHSELVKKIPIKDLKVCYNNMLKFVELKLEQIRDEKPFFKLITSLHVHTTSECECV